MKELMLVGGLPCSGKSYLCDRLAEKAPQTYLNLGIDRLHDELEKDAATFAYCFERLPLALKLSIGAGHSENITPAQFKIVAQALGGKQMWQLYMQQLANVCLIDRLAKADLDSVPIIESLFDTRERRRMALDSWKDMASLMSQVDKGYAFDFDEQKKTLVYLDTNVDVCVARLKQKGMSEEWETNIRAMHKMQEIPLSYESPNLEIVILSSESQVAEFIDKASGEN